MGNHHFEWENLLEMRYLHWLCNRLPQGTYVFFFVNGFWMILIRPESQKVRNGIYSWDDSGAHTQPGND